MILHLETDHLVPIARFAPARGGIASPEFEIPPPSCLRRIESPIHLMFKVRNWAKENYSILVDHTKCVCTLCGVTSEPELVGMSPVVLTLLHADVQSSMKFPYLSKFPCLNATSASSSNHFGFEI